MKNKTSLRSRLLERLLWISGLKKRFGKVKGLRERVLKNRPKNAGPSRSYFRRYTVSRTLQNNRSVFTLAPRTAAVRQHILYLHGGAYVYEIVSLQWSMLRPILDGANAAVTVPLFPLAPESTCEEILAFALESWRAMVRQANGLPVILMGDSAGGGMALALSQLLRDKGEEQAHSLLLLSPWLDVTCSDPRQADIERSDPMLTRAGLREEGLWYAGKLSPFDPRVSPLFGDLGLLPKMLVFTGTHDLLHADVMRLSERLDSPKGVTVHEYHNMVHVWQWYPLPESKQAQNELVAFLNL